MNDFDVGKHPTPALFAKGRESKQNAAADYAAGLRVVTLKPGRTPVPWYKTGKTSCVRRAPTLAVGSFALANDMQRILIILGATLLVAGLLWPWLVKLGLGRLPGDIHVEGEHGGFYFPIVTGLVISIVLSVLFWIFRR